MVHYHTSIYGDYIDHHVLHLGHVMLTFSRLATQLSKGGRQPIIKVCLGRGFSAEFMKKQKNTKKNLKNQKKLNNYKNQFTKELP